MLNKNLLLTCFALLLASCSANTKNAANITQSKKEIISLENEELKKSASNPQVVYFATNISKLDAEAVSVLNQQVLAEAKSSKTKQVVIEAHCDERGSAYYNQKLSERRAKSVKSYLVKNGVNDAKIKTIGYGESKPVDLGHDEESWAKNRRAVTISIKK